MKKTILNLFWNTFHNTQPIPGTLAKRAEGINFFLLRAPCKNLLRGSRIILERAPVPMVLMVFN
jgi:hypothetical protein